MQRERGKDDGRRTCPECGAAFTARRIGHIYCSPACRNKAHRAKVAKISKRKRDKRLRTKLTKLSSSSFGTWLVKELRRAGSVEVLRGHTKATLNELAELRRKCNKYSGFNDDGRPLGTYELSHIYPVSGKLGLGRLHPINIVIAESSFNRRHGSREPSDHIDGLVCDYGLLESKWTIDGEMTAKEILMLARRFIGSSLFDDWLKSFSITPGQHTTLVNDLLKSGGTGHTLEQLTRLSMEELKTFADCSGVEYFSLHINPAESISVVAEELERQGFVNALSVVARHIAKARTDWFVDNFLLGLVSNSDIKTVEQHVISQSLACLHHMPYESSWEGVDFFDWLPQLAREAEVFDQESRTL